MAAGAPASPRAASEEQGRLLNPSELSFDTLCRLMQTLKDTGAKFKKRSNLVKRFIDRNIVKRSRDAFSVFRLLLPKLDNVRGNYHLLETKLAKAFIQAAGISKGAEEAKAVENWRKPGARSAGSFADIVKHQILEQACFIAADDRQAARKLKVGHLNDQLDALVAAAGDLGAQARILQHLLTITTADQMAWILQIILKDLKINCSEGTILKLWHPDAEEYYNNSGMDLRYIFNEMIDEHRRFSASLKPGAPVRPQMAKATNNVHWAAEWMHKHHGGKFLLESKFDGERMQVHRYALPAAEALPGEGLQPGQDTVGYFSRKAIEHGGRSNYSVMDDVIRRATRGPCILDGELIVWHKKKGVFASFGSLKPLITAIVDKKSGSDVVEYNSVDEAKSAVKDDDYEDMLVQDCELVYVVFDVLHNGDSPVNMEPLSMRLQLVQQLVTPGESVPLGNSCVCGRVEVMVPGKTRFAGRLVSRYGSTAQDIQAAMEESLRLKEEGIMIKALDSHWTPNDRSPRWLKFKPDYLTNMELDAVVIGAWGGKGGRGNLYTQYLLALAEPPGLSGRVTRWVSFCRVGSGLDVDERKQVHEHLEPLCVDASPSHPPPDFYSITGREKPDVWVTDPSRSIVFEVQADLRSIRTNIFATGYSLRFPRIQRTRYDKDGQTTNTVQDLQDWVDREKGRLEEQGETALEALRNPREDGKKLKRKTGKRDTERMAKRRKVQVLGQFKLDDAKVEVESEALQGCLVYIANSTGFNKKELQEAVKRLGGENSAMCIGSVTHVLASGENKEVKKLADKDRDVIHVSWLLECAAQKRRVHVKPRYYIHRSCASIAADPEVDSMGDSYTADVDAGDVEHLLGRALRPGQVSVDALAASLAQPSDFEGTDEEGQAHLPRRLSSGDAAAAVASYLDAQLAAICQLDRRFCALRGCTVTLLCLGAGSASEASGGASGAGNGAVKQEQGTDEGSGGSNGDGDLTQKLVPRVRELVQQGRRSLARLQELQAATAAAEVSIMGGSVAAALSAQTTHVVGVVLPRQAASVGPSGEPRLQHAPAEPAVVLRAVAEQQRAGGVAVASLRMGLSSRGMHLVSDAWVHRCLEQAENGAAGLPSEDGFRLAPTNPDSLQHWPWELYPAMPSPPRRQAASQAAAPASRAARGAGVAGRRRGTATQGSPKVKPLLAPAGRARVAREPASSSVKQEEKPEAEAEAGSRPRRGDRAVTARGPGARGAARKLQPAAAAAAAPPPAAAAPAAAAAAMPAGRVKSEPMSLEEGEAGGAQQAPAAAPPQLPAVQLPAAAAPQVPSLWDDLFGGGTAPAPLAPAAAAPAALPQPLAELLARTTSAPRLPAEAGPAEAGMLAAAPAAPVSSWQPDAGGPHDAAPAPSAAADTQQPPPQQQQPTENAGTDGEPAAKPKMGLRERLARLKAAGGAG